MLWSLESIFLHNSKLIKKYNIYYYVAVAQIVNHQTRNTVVTKSKHVSKMVAHSLESN